MSVAPELAEPGLARAARELIAARRSARHCVLGSRKSDLAMWQARLVQSHLSTSFPDYTFTISTEITSGDSKLDAHLAVLAAASPGLFTKELEIGLLAGAYDIAVHSLKDMPTSLPAGLVLGAVTEREDPRDAMIASKRHTAAGGGTLTSLGDLPAGSVVGTSSVRREALLRRQYPHLRVESVRGNLATRFRKLDEDEGAPATEGAAAVSYDVLLLAYAGVKRLGWQDRVTCALDPAEWPYGVGQGALGLEARAGDEVAAAMCRSLVHVPSALACLAERAFMNRLQGGCQVPIGVHSTLEVGPPGAAAASATLSVDGTVCALDGSAIYTASVRRAVALPAVAAALSAEDWATLQLACSDFGSALAARILAAGADAVLGPLTRARPITYGSAETAGSDAGTAAATALQ